MAQKKDVRKKTVLRGKRKEKRLEKAYQEWKKGKTNSLKELSVKHGLHIPDVSAYITNQFNLSKTKKQV